jgi:hypothetical protein
MPSAIGDQTFGVFGKIIGARKIVRMTPRAQRIKLNLP